MNKDECYFIALKSGKVFQAIFKGLHSATSCYWFKELPFRSVESGPSWVPVNDVVITLSLGHPNINSEFETALEKILD